MRKLVFSNLSVIAFALMVVSVYYENIVWTIILFVISQLLFVLRK